MTILVSVWQRLFLPTYFTIQLIFATIYDLTPLFSTIHGYHRIISANFYIYLQYFNKFFFFFEMNNLRIRLEIIYLAKTEIFLLKLL